MTFFLFSFKSSIRSIMEGSKEMETIDLMQNKHLLNKYEGFKVDRVARFVVTNHFEEDCVSYFLMSRNRGQNTSVHPTSMKTVTFVIAKGNYYQKKDIS